MIDTFQKMQEIGQKAMVSIPGWAAAFNDRGSKGTLAYTRSPWANRCIEIRMSALSKIPWEIADADGETVDSSKAGDVLDESKIKNLLKLAEADLLLHGHAFWVWGEDGTQKTGLRRLNAGTMTVEKNSQGVAEFVQNLDGKMIHFDVDEVVWFHEFDPDDDLDGVAKVDVARMAIDAEYNADRYLTAFFKNFAIPPVIFTTSMQLPEAEAQKAQAWWRRLFGGVQNQHKAGFLGNDMKVNQLGFEPDKLALESVRLEARRSICATFGVPPTVANASDPGSYATADEQRQSLYEETIVPRAEWFAEQITEQIVALFDPTQEFRFRTEDLPTMQEDENKKAERLSGLVLAGIITAQAAAEELEYTAEETGEGRQVAFSGLGGFGQDAPSVPEKAIFQPVEAPEPDRGLLDDLRRWRAKSAKRVKAGRSAVVEFHSESIPAALQQALHGQLDGANTVDEVHDVFDRAERDMAGGRVAKEPEMQIHTHVHLPDNMKIETSAPVVNVAQPAITVNVPEQAPPNIEIQNNVQPTSVMVEAPEVHVFNEADTAKGKAEPRLRSRKEKSKVTRDRKGEMLGTETVSTYEYDDEA